VKEPPVSDSSKEYFDSIGAGWDRLRESFFQERVRDVALAAAGVRKGHTAADLGAGTGFITEGLFARDVRVVAVDRSASMLEALRRKFPWPDRVECRTGEAENLPIADASVDHCLANMLLHHVERPLVAIREMVRIVKPGGRVVVTDLDAHEIAFLRDEHHDRWMGFERESMLKWFRDAGLTDVRVENLGDECCCSSSGGRRAAVSIFVASGTRPRVSP
jgi:ubiquinone/menaquinone biosynthesis C-methylase UbiE